MYRGKGVRGGRGVAVRQCETDPQGCGWAGGGGVVVLKSSLPLPAPRESARRQALGLAQTPDCPASRVSRVEAEWEGEGSREE